VTVKDQLHSEEMKTGKITKIVTYIDKYNIYFFHPINHLLEKERKKQETE